MHESVSQGSGCLNTSALVSKLVNVLEHEALREGTKTFSGRRTFPRLYTAGTLISRYSGMREMNESGELQAMLAKARPSRPGARA